MTDFGGLCYLSDGLPEKYRGRLFFSEWGQGGLFVIEVARDGATFRFVKNTPLLQGGNGSDFRPMQLSVAADGSLLIADWQWGGWKGPKTVGTIWRLSWPEAQPAPRLKGREQSHPRRTPRRPRPSRPRPAAPGAGAIVDRTLVEVLPLRPGDEWRDAKTIHKIIDVMSDEKAESLRRIHALWAMSALAQRETREAWKRHFQRGNAATELNPMESRDLVLRSQAAKAMDQSFKFSNVGMMNDPDADVRLHAALASAWSGNFTPEYLKLRDCS